jgi:hypothetical protein
MSQSLEAFSGYRVWAGKYNANMKPLRILSVGPVEGVSNTCTHRNEALKKIAAQCDVVSTNLRPMSLYSRIAYHLWLKRLPIRIAENNRENENIRCLIDQNEYDVVWIDKGWTINPETLRYIKQKQPKCVIVSYSPDNMAMRFNQTWNYVQCVPLYDYIITPKSYILDDMRRLGAKDIRFVNKSYEATFHYPRELSPEDYVRLGGDVGFVGSWEAERCKSILYLADHGIKVRVFGDARWKPYVNYSPNLTIELGGLFNEDYAKSFKAFKISLCFLRKMNFDQQTSRTMEIPACGGFMLAERTKEHLALFEEGKEAAFFSSDEELLEKCRYYLSNDEERQCVAEAGTLRCKTSDYSNEGMIRKVLQEILSDKSR